MRASGQARSANIESTFEGFIDRGYRTKEAL